MVLEVDENGKSAGKVISAKRRQGPNVAQLSEDASSSSYSTTASPLSSSPMHAANAFYGKWQASAASSAATPSSSLAAPDAHDSVDPHRDPLGPPLNPYHGLQLTSTAVETRSSTAANPFLSVDDTGESVSESDIYGGIARTSVQHSSTGRRVSGNSPPPANRDLGRNTEDNLGTLILTTEGTEEEVAPSYEAVVRGHSGAFPEERAAPRG